MGSWKVGTSENSAHSTANLYWAATSCQVWGGTGLQWWMRQVSSSPSAWSLESSRRDRQLPRSHNLGLLILKERNSTLGEITVCIAHVDRQCGRRGGFSCCEQGHFPKEARLWERLKGTSQENTSEGAPWVERAASINPKAGKNLATSRNWKAAVRPPQSEGQAGRGSGAGDGTAKVGRTQPTRSPVVCDGTYFLLSGCCSNYYYSFGSCSYSEIIIHYFDFKITITRLQSNTLSSLSSNRITLWLIIVLNKAPVLGIKVLNESIGCQSAKS